MIFSPKAARLVRNLLVAHAAYLEMNILAINDEDRISEFSNDLGFVLTIIKSIDNDTKR